MRPRTRVIVAAGVAVTLAIAAGLVVMSGPDHQAAAAQRSHVSVATVQREALSATVSEAGTLTYGARPDGSPYTVANQASGAYTQLPEVGRVLRQGHVLYRVNNSPVVLLYGSTPAYRTLSPGITGPDVAELNADLLALGYATRAELSPTSSAYGSATTIAVQKLQATVGLAQSGTLALGKVVFEPTALRVTVVSALLGGRGAAGQMVMQGTSTSPQVQLALDTSQENEVSVGDKVTITLPNNRLTPGVVTSVGAVATCVSGASSGSVGSGSGSTTSGTDDCSSGSSSSSTPTVTVDIRPSDRAATARWDQAPVQVGITTSRIPSALVVPVTALLAESSGGYDVEVVGSGGRTQLVPVSLGLFDDADGLVQVTGSRLAAGQKVVVPSA